MNNSLKDLEEKVWKYVETLRYSPAARLKSRDDFYKKYGDGDKSEKYGYGDSEIAFLGWEERCVLRPPDAKPPGSAWWSEVNLWFIYLSELGAEAYEVNFPKSQLPVAAQFWVTFIEKPGSVSWYRAHNSSIIDGYLKYPHLAKKETIPEIIFINMVLYRLLFAQSMVDGQFIFPKLSKILGDPKGAAVQFITHLDAYYPSHYPMTKDEIADVLGKTHSLDELGVKFLDDVLIEPELTHLYQAASTWNKQPGLTGLVADHKPAYPNGIHVPGTHKGFFIKILIWFRKLFLKNK
jgi:hypothetical protein